MNQLRNIKNCELIEIKIANTTNSRWAFPFSENLKGKKVTALETYQVANVAKAPSGNDLINATAFMDAFLTLQVSGKEKIKEIPLVSFVASSNNGLIKTIEPDVIDLQKSYVSFSQQTNVVANESIIFAFYFE
jgi:hypothetical protein